MKVTLSLEKSIEENASVYFDKAKKAKKKTEGATEALERSRKKLAKIKKEEAKIVEEVVIEKRKREWYEKFRWFVSSEGFLVIGGRDATTNEIVIKKHTEKEDIVFHTDMSGSPFFVIKSEGKEIGEATINETGTATAVFSRAWKLGLGTADVFYVTPDQVSKEAQSGEYMSKGAFMIRGKKKYLHPDMDLAVGVNAAGMFISGSFSAVSANAAGEVIKLKQGKGKSSDLAKKMKNKYGLHDNDEIIRMLPAGGIDMPIARRSK